VQIVSLTQGRLSCDFGQSAPLLITLAITPANPAPIHVRAVGIPERLYYELGADMRGGRALDWPIKEVVIPQRIAPTDIGVYAFHAGVGGDPVLLPVSISAGALTASPQPFMVILRVGAVVNPRWRFISTGGAAGPFIPASIDDNRITLALPAALHLPGRLELRWDEAGSGKSHITVVAIGIDLSVDPKQPAKTSRAERLRIFWRRHGSFVLIACVIGGTLVLATLRWQGELRLSGRLVASSVTMVLDDSLQVEPDLDFDPGEVRLSGLRSIQPPAEIATERIEATSATIRAKRITLSAIHLGSGAELTLDAAKRASTWLQAAGAGDRSNLRPTDRCQ
jgi:hypothetical protein